MYVCLLVFVVGRERMYSMTIIVHVLHAGQPTAFLTLGQVKELDLGRKEKPDYFSCKAGITFIKKDNCLYKVSPPTTMLGWRQALSEFGYPCRPVLTLTVTKR